MANSYYVLLTVETQEEENSWLSHATEKKLMGFTFESNAYKWFYNTAFENLHDAFLQVPYEERELTTAYLSLWCRHYDTVELAGDYTETRLAEAVYDLKRFRFLDVGRTEEERAVSHLMNVSHVDKKTAEYLIEWIADNPIPWADMYAPYIYQVSEAEAETWEQEYPHDTVIYDDCINGAVVISDCPIWLGA